MKIAISSTTQNIDDKIDETFGRCPYFIIAEIENGKIEKSEAIKNESIEQTSGAGISAAQLVVDKKVEAVITGNVGPRAFDVLNQFKIKVYTGKGVVKEAIQDCIDNKLEEIK
ncbi:MAG: NifB/NifX family molybdenum-iron cluster-binding protein [Patescibacteria group bacterium]